MDEKIPADFPARLVNHIVDNLIITKIIDTYKGGGTSAYHLRMMLKKLEEYEKKLETLESRGSYSKSGYVSNLTYYEVKNCKDCPLKCLCHKAKGNRSIEINHQLNRFWKQAKERLTCEEGYRSRCPIEPEAVFGQMKENKSSAASDTSGRTKSKWTLPFLPLPSIPEKCTINGLNFAQNPLKNEKKQDCFCVFVFERSKKH